MYLEPDIQGSTKRNRAKSLKPEPQHRTSRLFSAALAQGVGRLDSERSAERFDFLKQHKGLSQNLRFVVSCALREAAKGKSKKQKGRLEKSAHQNSPQSRSAARKLP
jgi:hypothetical protein